MSMKKTNKKKTLSVKDIRKQQLKAKKAKQKELTARNKEKYIFRNGKFNQKAFENLVEKHSDKIATISDKKMLERTAKMLSKTTSKITTERLWASYSNDRIAGMLANTGQTLEQLAEMTNSTPQRLLDREAWNDDFTVFINENGEMFEFEFGYNASTMFVKAN